MRPARAAHHGRSAVPGRAPLARAVRPGSASLNRPAPRVPRGCPRRAGRPRRAADLGAPPRERAAHAMRAPFALADATLEPTRPGPRGAPLAIPAAIARESVARATRAPLTARGQRTPLRCRGASWSSAPPRAVRVPLALRCEPLRVAAGLGGPVALVAALGATRRAVAAAVPLALAWLSRRGPTGRSRSRDAIAAISSAPSSRRTSRARVRALHRREASLVIAPAVRGRREGSRWGWYDVRRPDGMVGGSRGVAANFGARAGSRVA